MIKALGGASMTKSIPLTQGQNAIVDDKDFEYLNQWKWQYSDGYASRSETRFGMGKKTIYMHRVILDTPPGMQTDHIDGNKLNNQRVNLRVCSIAENGRNRKLQKNNTSGFSGVHYAKKAEKWQATIRVNGKVVYLKTYNTAKEAALAYDEAAKKYFGEFARLNFTDG
jgi:hypothetical protein